MTEPEGAPERKPQKLEKKTFLPAKKRYCKRIEPFYSKFMIRES